MILPGCAGSEMHAGHVGCIEGWLARFDCIYCIHFSKLFPKLNVGLLGFSSLYSLSYSVTFSGSSSSILSIINHNHLRPTFGQHFLHANIGSLNGVSTLRSGSCPVCREELGLDTDTEEEFFEARSG